MTRFLIAVGLVAIGCTGAPDPAEPRSLEPEPCLWHIDADGDGYGDARTLALCAPSDGYVADASDCDDTDPDIRPGAIERCDGHRVDEDCDGLVNDDDPSVQGGVPTWPDVDGDGFGDRTAEPELRCVVGLYRSRDGTDCDDADPFTFVGAAGLEDAWACMTDRDLDGWGDADAVEPVEAGSDCDDADAGLSPIAQDVFGDGIDQDCSGEDLWSLHDGFESGGPHPWVWWRDIGGYPEDVGALGTRRSWRVYSQNLLTEPVDTRVCETLAWEMWVLYWEDELSNYGSGPITVAFHDGVSWIELLRYDEPPPRGFVRLRGPVDAPGAFREGFQLRITVGGSITFDEIRLSCAGSDQDGDGIGDRADCDDADPHHWSDCGRCVDSDGDGFGEECDLGLDCDDTLSAAHPGGTDVDINGIDEDCNGYDGQGLFDDFEAGARTVPIWDTPMHAAYSGWYVREGRFALGLGRDGEVTSQPVDTSGCERLYWSMHALRRWTELGDRLEIALFDGGQWVVVDTVDGSGADDAAFRFHSGMVDERSLMGMHTRLRLRVLKGGGFSSPSFYVDDLLLECSGPDTDGDGFPEQRDWDDGDARRWTGPCTDVDDDGFGPGCDLGEDCRDTDASYSPLADDPYGDGEDTNCDGFDGDVLFDDFDSGWTNPSAWGYFSRVAVSGDSDGRSLVLGRTAFAETTTIDTSDCAAVMWSFQGLRGTPDLDEELTVSYWDGAQWVRTYGWPGKGTPDAFWTPHAGLLEGDDVTHPVFRMRWSVEDISSYGYSIDDVLVACSEPDTDGDGVAGLVDCAPDDGHHWFDCGACIDLDGDGYGVNCDLGIDCVPTEASIHPGMDDPLGDGIDSDCSGADGVGWYDGFESGGATGFWTYLGDVAYEHDAASTGSLGLELRGEASIESIGIDTSACSALSWSFHSADHPHYPPEPAEALVVSWSDGSGWTELVRVPGGSASSGFVPQQGVLADAAALTGDFRLRFVLESIGANWSDAVHLDDVQLHCVP
ncbi:MAG: putative metal-binding motif-containing protein [Myxococcota bacterium]